MLRHHHIPSHHKPIAQTHPLQRILKEIASRSPAQIGQPVITAKSQKMKVTSMVIANQPLSHRRKNSTASSLRAAIRTKSASLPTTKGAPHLVLEMWETTTADLAFVSGIVLACHPAGCPILSRTLRKGGTTETATETRLIPDLRVRSNRSTPTSDPFWIRPIQVISRLAV